MYLHENLYQHGLKYLSMQFVLDTSAILSGTFFVGEIITTPKVIDEFTPGGHAWRILQYMMEAGLKIMCPPQQAIKKVKNTAKKTGDIDDLSLTDIEILALALHLKNDVMLLTDDYAMQNVAKELGIHWKGILEKGIKEKIYWAYRCASCGKRVPMGYVACPICGGKLKKVRKPKT